MFPRIVKAAGGAGTTYEYVRLVESYREGNKTKQRVVFTTSVGATSSPSIS